MLASAVRYPDTSYILIGKTSKSVRAAAWRYLRQLNHEFQLDGRLQETFQRISLPNGSEFDLQGADKAGWADRLRGAAYKSVAIDEAAFFDIDLRDFVREVVRPTLADHRGTLILTSTPGRAKSGFFYDVTFKNEPGWTTHRWSALDNPHMDAQFAEEVERLKTENPHVESEPWFRREYLGEWAFEESEFVYAYDQSLNTVESWERTDGDRLVLGIDLGYSPDSTAFSVLAWRPDSPIVTFIETFKRSELKIDEIAMLVRSYIERFRGIVCFGDSANKQVFEELRKRYALPIIPADKRDKRMFIEFMNSDFRAGNIKLVEGDCESYADELEKLTWVEKGGEKLENPTLHNDVTDSALYAYRAARHYRSKPPEDKPRPGTAAYIDDQAERRRKEYLKRLRAAQRGEDD